MSMRYKIVAMAVTCFLVICFTVLGVIAAKRISSQPLGSQVAIEELDKEDSRVGMVNFLIIGVDEDGLRSDTIMLVSYDGYSDRLNILSLPRDTQVVMNGYKQKLNAAIGVGAQNVKNGKDQEPEEELIRQVKALTGLPVHYFMTVDFDGFIEIIDALGGVDFNVPYNMNYDDPAQDLHIHLKKGPQHLDGQQAHDFVRFRHNTDNSAPGEYAMGDEGRIYWQQRFLKELLLQKAKPQYFANITDVFDVITRNVRTNYTVQDLLMHIDEMQKFDFSNIGMYELPGEAKYMDELWWYIYDEDKTSALIQEVFLPRSAEQWAQEQAAAAAEEAGAEGADGTAAAGGTSSTSGTGSTAKPSVTVAPAPEGTAKSQSARTASPVR